MDGETYTPNGSPSTTVKNRLNSNPNSVNNMSPVSYAVNKDETNVTWLLNLNDAHFMRWKTGDVLGVTRVHPALCAFAFAMLFFMFVEYTLYMIPYTSEPFDIGFVVTRGLNRMLAENAGLNTLLAGLNTVYVGMQTMYILWAWLVEGRPRATISALFMFTCRGILGYSTQLPLPKEFLGSGADFPVGNVSFFLFYSGHVAASVIASLDMRRVKRWELARFFDILNILQAVRLLSTRGHYTIDLAVGVGAGILFDSLAGKYEENKRKTAKLSVGNGSGATRNTIEGKNWSMSKNSSF